MRLARGFRYAVYPAWGDFFEYRMTRKQFLDELHAAGFEVIKSAPIGEMDGLFHELNPFGLLVKFERWKFYPTRLGALINRWASKRPYFHPHMQACVVRKPLP